MKQIWNENWQFTKAAPDSKDVIWEPVTLPHTWNGIDGQDGGNDFYRGVCYYQKSLRSSELPACDDVYLEFAGANSSADLYVNGKHLAHHDGGYSVWRCRLTEALQEENEILVAVDNAPNDHVYPQQADFTFYGGLYRDVSLLFVKKCRFDLDYFGSPGIAVTPAVEGTDAIVKIQAWLTGASGSEALTFTIFDGATSVAETITTAKNPAAQIKLPNVHPWNGRKDPHLYTLKAVLSDETGMLDERTVRFGCRTFRIDPENGFFLNEKPYPLHGVSRHQDRPEKGNAISRQDHEEDMALICEMGANTIRLAHYQHDRYFYDLCDEKGMVVWAEIPYISRHLENGQENTLSQMRELIVQNYNHPSIVVWGLSNEITMGGASTPGLLQNHRELNDLCHRLDPARLTTLAAVSMCGIDESYLRIPDVISYNHYFGWYGGTLDKNGKFFDDFHKKYPNQAIGMSEYGCEALNWHSSDPVQGDYTEEYQAHYHEELIRQLFSRPFIWATHVWNMFDFGADSRSEGGEDGKNHKGLVTFDRKYKKDAFYAYKSWLSDEPFVHLCGKRYVNRAEPLTKVTVYSNQPEVELFVNGKSLGKKTSAEHFFYYSVPNEGESVLLAEAGGCRDESRIKRVEVFDEAYRMKETGGVINWLDITAPEGFYSINDRVGEVMRSTRGKLYLLSEAARLMRRKKAGKKERSGGGSGLKVDKNLIGMMENFTVKRILGMVDHAGLEPLTKEEMLQINRKLNKIRKKTGGTP